jgi:salicylate hydroxylase
MLPHLGSGAGQSIEDAFLLSKVLLLSIKSQTALPRRQILKRISAALNVYDTVRRPIANKVQSLSTLQGRIYSLAEGGDSVEMERRVKENLLSCK